MPPSFEKEAMLSSSIAKRDRSDLYRHLPLTEIVSRYRKNFGLDDSIGPEEVGKHAVVEADLTDLLLGSDTENRAAAFSQAYSRLYSELPWLVDTGMTGGAAVWEKLLRPHSRIYEIGSGAGYLIRHLARRGYDCVRTDICEQRTGVENVVEDNLRQGVTDGVHLSRYANEETYDYVISNQVLEHLHPDDLPTHFAEARKLLKPGGEYIFTTPYAPFGPADLSLVFGLDRPVFMHLHEMTYADVRRLANEAGFAETSAIVTLAKGAIARRSKLYARYLFAADRLLRTRKIPDKGLVNKVAKGLMIKKNVFMSLRK